MALVETLRASFERTLGLYREFAEALPEAALDQRLPGIPSNKIGLQLWCVVGARESYSRGIVAGAWDGFTCSLIEPKRSVAVREALDRSAQVVREALVGAEEWSANQSQLALDLLEHEAMHQGQLIRYLYGLELPIPADWKARYALD